MSGYSTFNLAELMQGDATFDQEDEMLAMKSINEMQEEEAQEAGMYVDPQGTIWDSEAEYHMEMKMVEQHTNLSF